MTFKQGHQRQSILNVPIHNYRTGIQWPRILVHSFMNFLTADSAVSCARFSALPTDEPCTKYITRSMQYRIHAYMYRAAGAYVHILSPSLSSGTRAHARACGLLGIPTKKFDRDHNLVRHFRVTYIKFHRSIEFSLQSGRA